MDRIIEICCGSYEDAINAYRGGAKRIELNSALYLGGLTPSIATLELIKRNTDLEVICMVRPRGAGFCYSDLEKKQIFAEAKALLEHGADGLAFGFLTEDRTIDLECTQKMVNLVHHYGKTAVFHRAFDCVKDDKTAINELIKLNVDRVLTSGLKATAIEGKELIRSLQETVGAKIEILAGSGINKDNAKDLIEHTKVKQIHSSCRAWKEDKTTFGDFVNYAFAQGENKACYDYVDENLVRNLIKAVNE